MTSQVKETGDMYGGKKEEENEKKQSKVNWKKLKECRMKERTDSACMLSICLLLKKGTEGGWAAV